MENDCSRRQFITSLAVYGGATLLSAISAQADSPGAWVVVGSAAKIKQDEFTHIILPDAYDAEEVYVTKKADGSYFALSSRCTHKGCIIDWQSDRKQFVCPCHRGRFDADGKNVGGPPPKPLSVLQTKVDKKGILSLWIV